jgi:hypothetical protein
MASEKFKLLTVDNSIVGLAGLAGPLLKGAIGVLGRNWETCGAEAEVEEEDEVKVEFVIGFPSFEREVEEEGNLKENGGKVILKQGGCQ